MHGPDWVHEIKHDGYRLMGAGPGPDRHPAADQERLRLVAALPADRHATLAMTADTYGHLFPSTDAHNELAAAERAMGLHVA